MRTGVSGAIVEMWRVASTPPIPGMFRSITTTSGASSRTILSASCPAAASPTICTPSSSSRFRNPLLNRSWSSTIRTRTPSNACWSMLMLLMGLVQRNGNGAATPRKGIGKGGEPEVDRVAAHRAPGVGGDALAVAGDGHARPQRNHRRVDGDDAEADRKPGRRVAREGVARGGDGDRPRGGARGSGSGSGSGGPGPLRLDRRGLLDDAACMRVERGELALREATLARERGEVLHARRPGALERGGGCPRTRLELFRLTGLHGKRARELRELRVPLTGVADGSLALARALFQVVEPSDGIVEGAGAEQDCDRVRFPFLVQRPQVRAEQILRHAQVVPDDLQLHVRLVPLGSQRQDALVNACELAARLGEAKVERVEAEESAVRPRCKGALVLLQRCLVLSSREGRAEQDCCKEREPEREAALPSTTHGAGHYQRIGMCP